jgi:hypothetical protein
MKINHFERGQALIIIALALVGLAGIAGLVIDGGNAFQDKQRAQNAVDAAALASAHARITGGDLVGAAMASAAENGYNNDGVTNIISLYSPPKDGPHTGDIEYIQVIIKSTVTTYFARVVGTNQIINEVQATARTKAPEIGPLLHGHAVISLAPTSNCFNRLSFWIHGEATLDITGGGVFVNSSNQACALKQQGNGSIRLEEGYGINVVGNANVQRPCSPPHPGAMPVPTAVLRAQSKMAMQISRMARLEWAWDDAFPTGYPIWSGPCSAMGRTSPAPRGHNVVFT